METNDSKTDFFEKFVLINVSMFKKIIYTKYLNENVRNYKIKKNWLG
jgi:hypothetical protein